MGLYIWNLSSTHLSINLELLLSNIFIVITQVTITSLGYGYYRNHPGYRGSYLSFFAVLDFLHTQ